jgi:hypothetical protein
MGNFKSFMLGVGVSFAAYYLTKKGTDGRSVLDDIIDNPKAFAEKAKDYAMAEVVETVKKEIS